MPLFRQRPYPWTVIHVEDRAIYMHALETPSVDENLRPFAEFIARSILRAADA